MFLNAETNIFKGWSWSLFRWIKTGFIPQSGFDGNLNLQSQYILVKHKFKIHPQNPFEDFIFIFNILLFLFRDVKTGMTRDLCVKSDFFQEYVF